MNKAGIHIPGRHQSQEQQADPYRSWQWKIYLISFPPAPGLKSGNQLPHKLFLPFNVKNKLEKPLKLLLRQFPIADRIYWWRYCYRLHSANILIH